MITIELKQKYKSFDPIEFELDGNLIIISGVNGTGKSQLGDIFKGYQKNAHMATIERLISLNGTEIQHNEIVYKSFREYSDLAELSSAHINNRSNAIGQVHAWYTNQRLQYEPQSNAQYRDALTKLRAEMIKIWGEQKFNEGTITQEEISNEFPEDFVLLQDDLFTNKVGELFFAYADKVYNLYAKSGKTGVPFDKDQLPIPPWTQLNELFKELKFDYRFKEDYEYINHALNEQPAIFPIDKNGKLDAASKRTLGDLSDGEKAIISLVFAAITVDKRTPKILVLDEYDATLNPSLVSNFYAVLNKFFVQRGTVVVVITHSATTISLAPEQAAFYEIYKLDKGEPRILTVDREQYQELAVANKKFYDRIADQETRHQTLVTKNYELEKLLAENNKLQIFSEGKNIKHIEKAITVLAPELLDKIYIVSNIEAASGKTQMRTAYQFVINTKTNNQFLFVWDNDARASVDVLNETGNCKKFCFEDYDNGALENGIENLYDKELVTKDLFDAIPRKDNPNDTVDKLSKNRFEMRVLAENDPDIFKNYAPLIERIKSILQV